MESKPARRDGFNQTSARAAHDSGASRSRSGSPASSRSRSRSHSRSPSRPHTAHRSRSFSKDSRSLSPEPREEQYRVRDSPPLKNVREEREFRHRRRYSSTSMASRDSRARLRDRSRSPEANSRKAAGGGRRGPRRSQDETHFARRGDVREGREDEVPRERSLSPFSKRMALTRATGSGR